MNNVILGLVFLSQILLISWYFPKKMVARMRYVMATYPPAEYPKLYPSPEEDYRKFHRSFERQNQLIVFLGLIVLGLMLFTEAAWLPREEAVFGIFYMIQFLPIIRIELSEFSQTKKMREAVQTGERSADFTPRRFFDLVSPALVIGAALMFFAVLVLDVTLFGYPLEYGGYAGSRAMVLLLCNLLFLAIIWWNFRGKKMNPHQTEADRRKQNKVVFSALMIMSMALSAFFIVMSATNVYELDAYEPLLTSVYLQVIALMSIGATLKWISIEDMNFDVYK